MVLFGSHFHVACVVLLITFCFKNYCQFLEKYGKVPKAVKARRKEGPWWNIVVSLTHSTISSILLVYSSYNDPNFTSDLENHFSVLSQLAACFSLGYFLHDTVHLLKIYPLKGNLGILLHHAIMLTTLGKVLYSTKYINTVCIALFCEISSIFLHTRQLMKMSKLYMESFIFLIICISNIIVYTFVRFYVIYWLYNWFFTNYELIDFEYKMVYFVALTLMTLVNIVYFIIIINKDFVSLIFSRQKIIKQNN